MAKSTVSDAAAAMLGDYNCAQAVLASCGETFGLARKTAISVAQTLGGGVAGTGNVCGAVTGALMVIGLKHSIAEGFDAAIKEKATQLGQEFISRFKARHGTILCRELVGCDLLTREDRARAKPVTASICPGLVRDAAGMVNELLAED
jgi:C_GCAxxG_C_C family probable redox protein